MSVILKHKVASDVPVPASGYTALFFDDSGNLYGRKSDGTTVAFSPAGDASGVTYTPDNSLIWTDSTDPGNVAEALDDLAVRLNVVENDTATPPDASEVTYTPQTSLHWTDSEDPGQVDDALDDLAARVNALEETGGDGVTAADLQGTGLDADAAGFRGVPQNSQTVNYTTVAADAGKHLLHPLGAGAGDTFTIDSNANVAYEIGTAITFVNMATDSVSIAITSDTLRLAGAGTTGTRTLAQYGIATALKTGSTEWLISGTNLT